MIRSQDEFVVSFHMGFYRLLKWLLVLPFTFAAIAMTVRPTPCSAFAVLAIFDFAMSALHKCRH